MVDKLGKIAYTNAMLSKLTREYRHKLGLSQKRLAEEVGTHERTIRNIEAGKEASQLVKVQLRGWIREARAKELEVKGI